MSLLFSRSLRVFDRDNSRRALLLFLFITLLLGFWTVWFAISRVAVYASTTNARLEVARENRPVDTEVGGRVLLVHAVVGRVVKIGDPLIEFDAKSEQLARDEVQAGFQPTESQLTAMRDELQALERALEGERRASEAAQAQAQAEEDRARSAAQFAADESRRMQDLRRRDLVSDLEAVRARNAAVEKQNQADFAASAARRSVQEAEARKQDRLVQIAHLKREVATIQGARAGGLAADVRLTHTIEQRTIRAPIDGTIAEVTSVQPGRVLAAGSRICTIVPSGDLKIVAMYEPAVALGRVQKGQTARVRLEGFPWTQYGAPIARVSSVGGEPQDGKIRVELTLESKNPAIPFQHGLPAEVDVEVERTTPLNLVLRTIGAQTRLAAAGR